MAVFIPRLSMGMIYSMAYYTTWNAYWYSYRMPNCTAYAFGSFNERAHVSGLNYNWPTGNGCDWYVQAPGKNLQVGAVPALGAAACWWYQDSHGDPSGHVGIVEAITYDSNNVPVSFVTSNSAYYRSDPDDPMSDAGTPTDAFPYFYLETVYMATKDHRDGHPEAYFQGFVYHPNYPPNTPVLQIDDLLILLAQRKKRPRNITIEGRKFHG